MTPLEHSTALITIVVDDYFLGPIGTTWLLTESELARLRADLVALLTSRVLTSPLLVKPVDGDGER